MVSFASNLLCLEIGEGLLSLVAEAETKARETIHQAEEELEGAHAVVCFQRACCVCMYYYGRLFAATMNGV